MKIIFYNILKGALDENRFEKLIKFVDKYSPDILILSEANKWDDDNFKILNQFKLKTCFKYHIFSKSNTEYNLVIFSMHEIHKPLIIKDNIWHSVLIAEVKDTKFVILHLNPKGEEERLMEINTLKEHLQSHNTILVGDLNSLTKVDNYNIPQLNETCKLLNIKKFHIGDEISFKVHENILKLDFIDVHYKFKNEFDSTVPTKINKDLFHLTKLRLDFFYVKKNILSKIKEYSIIKCELTEIISDHYPILLNKE